MSDNSRAIPSVYTQTVDLEKLLREFDACGECRLEIGGPAKYKELNVAEIIAVVDGLQLLRNLRTPPDKIVWEKTPKPTRPVMIMEHAWDGDKRLYNIIDKQAAEFHGFGMDYIEYASGPANYSTAIVELPDGRIETVPAKMVRFMDVAS